MIFYVYCYFNPLKPSAEYGIEPFYVGKGKEDRKFFHLFESVLRTDHNRHKVNTIRKIRKVGLEPQIRILSEHVIEAEAFDQETFWIQKIGRADLGLGPLTNMTDGGEGTVNKIITDEYRRKLSAGTKRAFAAGKLNSNLSAFKNSQRGKKQTPEWIAKRSESKRRNHALKGYKPRPAPKGNPKAIPVVVFGIQYPSIGKAIKATGLTPGQVRKEAHV